MNKNYFSRTHNSPTKRKLDQNHHDNQQFSSSSQNPIKLKENPNSITPRNQIIQFDHPDASPYVFTAILNSQNCKSARIIKNIPKNNNQSSSKDINAFNNNESNLPDQLFEKQTSIILQNRRQLPRTATFRTREKNLANSKIKNDKLMLQIKKEIDSTRPKTVSWNESFSDRNLCMVSEPRQEKQSDEINNLARKQKQKVKQGPVGPSVTILSGKIIVDNEPIDINQKPTAAPLISTKAFCQDYTGVPNSLSFMF